MLRAIYDGKAGDIDPAMIQIIGGVLEKQVFDGFGSDFLGIDFKTPDGAMLTRLTRDTWSFASAKNYQQLRDMSLALVSETGQARSFSEFEEAAKAINAKYNRNWLLTEYNQAVGSATMAARWNEFEKNADLMPYLRYSTVGDRRVRDSHKALDGITKKISDDFWATYFPPNGWGCRCSVDQLPGSKQKESKTVPPVPVPAMFQTNLAKSGLIYPSTHPYYIGLPDDVKKAGISQSRRASANEAKTWAKANIEIDLGLTTKVSKDEFEILTVRRGDIKSITGKPHKYYESVAAITKNLGWVVKKSKYVDWSYDDGSHPFVAKWYYYEIRLCGEPSWLNVMETLKGEFRIHHISDNFDKNKLIKKQKAP